LRPRRNRTIRTKTMGPMNATREGAFARGHRRDATDLPHDCRVKNKGDARRNRLAMEGLSTGGAGFGFLQD
jgi:hypothetical protein